MLYFRRLKELNSNLLWLLWLHIDDGRLDDFQGGFHCPLFHYVAIRSLATQYLDFHSMVQAVFCKV
ncbi:unnamed protein product, partial [Cyprideis torosa]